MDKVWQLAERKYDDIIQQLLYNRGVFVNDREAVKRFLEPDFGCDLSNPFLIANMSKAVERIKKAGINNEKVGIFADYDADGIPGAALLYKALQKIKIDAIAYIPNRESGYGLSRDGIDYLIDRDCSLIITVDLGIRSVEEAEYCQEKKVDLIITDHHIIDEKIPKSYAIIHPRFPGSHYPFGDLCGCGVVYKLVWALATKFPEINEYFLKWNLDLVAISTVADVVPLTGENRLMAKYGLLVIKKTKNIGLKALIETAKLKPEMINTYSVGFQIAPRINAPGRIDHATKSFELLTTQDESEARILAEWLNQKNEDRQKEMEKIINDSVKSIEKGGLDKNKIIVVSGKWQRGVIGPSASKLVEKYGRPVIIFADEESEYVGSARSISGINIIQLFDGISDLLSKYGGHSGAAGLTVKKEDYQKFEKAIIDYADKQIDQTSLVPVIKIDAEVTPSQLSLKLCKDIEVFEPFGMGNARPVFLTMAVNLVNARRVGRDKNHLSCALATEKGNIKAIHFNCSDDLTISNHTKYDIIFTISIDSWNNNEQVSVNIIDIKENNNG